MGGQPVAAFEPSLGRDARTGSWEELSRGTFRLARESAEAGQHATAGELLRIAALEAEELFEVYGQWPQEVREWLLQRGTETATLDERLAQLADQLDNAILGSAEAERPLFDEAMEQATSACRAGDHQAPQLIEHARRTWQSIHDRGVDQLSGIISVACELAGEDTLGELWDHLMTDWYQVHEKRYALTNQPWQESARQLMFAITDGFHAHLAGRERLGDIEFVEEENRWGFRFQPCGSGGRSVDAAITDGKPRAGPPYNFAVTTRPHDWAWNTTGICSYCVHCCQLNERMPIQRLGYPTRVIDPPVWRGTDAGSATDSSCTWWVYKDPSLVPAAVYERVGLRAPTNTEAGEP